MRILAGDLRARAFDQPKTTSVRPLSDKVRAAIYDVVGSVEGYTVLDAYAGSGAAGFEAISRGAILCEAVEGDPKVTKIIAGNERALNLGLTYILYSVKLETWLASPAQTPPKPRYDLIIADPPYAKLEEDIIQKLVPFLTEHGVLVLSHSSKTKPPVLQSVELKVAKVYGDTALSFYQP